MYRDSGYIKVYRHVFFIKCITILLYRDNISHLYYLDLLAGIWAGMLVDEFNQIGYRLVI